MEVESDREASEREVRQWEEMWEEEWKKKRSDTLGWRALFSMIFEKEKAAIFSNIFEERGLEMREVFERGKVQVDIRSRGESYLRGLDVKWDSISKEEDFTDMFWKGRKEYDKYEHQVCVRENGKEWAKKLNKKAMSFMDTEEDVTFERHDVKIGPSSPEEIIKEAETKVREVCRKFYKAIDKDDNANRSFKRGWCEEHRDWCPISSECVPEDPLEKDRYWILDYRKFEEDVVFYKQKCEEEVRLIYAKESVREATTWQYKATQMLTRDMERIEQYNKYQLWPFTAYSPWPDHKSIPGETVDVSQEEMRYMLYEKKKLQKEEEYILFEKNLRRNHYVNRDILKPGLRRSGCCGYPHIPLEYFNLIVEGKEESLNFPALKCNMPLEGGALEHFTLTNCPSCQEKIEQNAIKCAEDDMETKEGENKAQIMISREEVNKSSSSDLEYYDYFTDPPSDFECDLTGELMTDPVLLPSGEIVCWQSIRRHLMVSTQNPFNREHLTSDLLKPDDELRTKIAMWKSEKKKAAREEIKRKSEGTTVDNKDDENKESEDSFCEDADNPDNMSETEEESMSDEKLERKKESEIEDARRKEWAMKYMANTTCHFCNKIFPSKANRKKHEKRNHSEKLSQHQCQLCEKKFTNSTALNYHASVKHEEKRTIFCKGCKLEFNSFNEYLEHKKRKRDKREEKTPKCDKCGERIARKHMKRHHKNVHKQVLLKGNRKPVVLDESTRKFKCDNCSKAFNREENLIRHISEVHIKTDQFSCKHCGNLFKRKQHLNVHILDSHSPFFTNFECHICRKTFGQKYTCDRHVREVHDDKNYQCVQCKKTFKQNSDRERHLKEVHESSKKNFKCPNCEKTFARKSNQTRHTKMCLSKTS